MIFIILSDEGVYDGQRDIYSNLMAGFVIPAGREIIHMKINKGKRPHIWDDLFASENIAIEIEYASIYDERWVVKGLFSEPVKIKGIDD
ncbi:hypothetical protein [Anditalea andensis]|nr:hypothetical protein [Anditalea andensis]